MCLHPELSLLTYFQILPDPRVARTREHRLIDLLVIAVCTLLCGGEGFNDMEDFGWAREEWLKTILELPGGIPSQDTFNRLFQALDRHSFLECFLRWTQSLRVAVAEEIVALDGKALRRALQAGGTAPVLVSAWAAGEWAGPGPNQGAGQEQLDHGRARTVAVPGTGRLHRHAGCDGLSEEHRPRDQRSRRGWPRPGATLTGINSGNPPNQERWRMHPSPIVQRGHPQKRDRELPPGL